MEQEQKVVEEIEYEEPSTQKKWVVWTVGILLILLILGYWAYTQGWLKWGMFQ